MLKKKISLLISITVASTALITACSDKQVSYNSSIEPLVKKYCFECHSTPEGDGTKASGFRVDTYEKLMKGTRYGPVIIPGIPIASTFYRMVAGKVDPSIKMPHGKDALTDDEINLIKLWIKEGAKDN